MKRSVTVLRTTSNKQQAIESKSETKSEAEEIDDEAATSKIGTYFLSLFYHCLCLMER